MRVRHERLALDTSAYGHMRRGHPTVLDTVAAADVVYLPVVVLGELEAGFLLGSRLEANLQTLAEFVAEPFVVVLDATPQVGRHYARLFAQLRRAGTPIPTNDIWIAASTFAADAHLLTFDSDFARIGGLAHTVLPAS